MEKVRLVSDLAPDVAQALVDLIKKVKESSNELQETEDKIKQGG